MLGAKVAASASEGAVSDIRKFFGFFCQNSKAIGGYLIMGIEAMKYIVTFDLDAPEDLDDLLQELESIGGYVRLSELAYALETGLDAPEVSYRLQSRLPGGQNVFVIDVNSEWTGAGRGPESVRAWLDDSQVVFTIED